MPTNAAEKACVVSPRFGTYKNAVRDEIDAASVPNILDNSLTERQKFCLAEPGLIRCFSPAYNETYKDSFPATDQKILAAPSTFQR
jgi:hypothetical protein